MKLRGKLPPDFLVEEVFSRLPSHLRRK